MSSAGPVVPSVPSSSGSSPYRPPSSPTASDDDLAATGDDHPPDHKDDEFLIFPSHDRPIHPKASPELSLMEPAPFSSEVVYDPAPSSSSSSSGDESSSPRLGRSPSSDGSAAAGSLEKDSVLGSAVGVAGAKGGSVSASTLVIDGRFNQDASCVSVGTASGFIVARVDPFTICRELTEHGCKIVEMLHSTSLVAVVGAGDDPSFSPRAIRLINSRTNERICHLNFPSAVLNLKLSLSRLVAVTERKIHLFDLRSMKKLHSIETAPNPLGLIAMCSKDESSCVAAIPAKTGDVMIYDVQNIQVLSVLKAHEGAIRVMAFNKEGSMLATTSVKGTIIRVFSVPEGKLLHEFRRGRAPAVVMSLSFNPSSSLLCASSDRQTVHIFDLKPKLKKKKGETQSFFPSMFSSSSREPVRDCGRIHLREDSRGTFLVSSFTAEDSLALFSQRGFLYRYKYDREKGECALVSEQSLFRPAEELSAGLFLRSV